MILFSLFYIFKDGEKRYNTSQKGSADERPSAIKDS
jgi:hypothetical protein